MSRSYQKPENALKRANEFIDVGKPTRALEVLYEVIKRGKMRTNYSEKLLEPIMFKYLELCVDLKKSHLAKEGLYQYRNIFQSVNVSSLETVVRFYLQLADERTESARKESHQAVVEIDDLDNLATPEEILLSAVSGEDAQDRSDRTILTPWVKFLWESYRQCLELLRTNSRVERLYHDIAKHAFKFCEKYSRKTEFRKLCDNLRTHLTHIQKQQGSATAVNLNNPETQQMNLETRLEQLNYAIKMELWQEAYKAIEDISDLMNKSKKMPKPHVMASYYQKLALVFWKAGNQLFHAAALFKLFQLLREQKKNITMEEVSKRASVVLVATLAIPLPSAHPEYDRFIETEKSALEKIDKLAVLLSLPKPPTRVSLIKDLVRLNVVVSVPLGLQNMYSLMEQEFDPLNLCKRMKVHFNWINERPESGLPQYVGALKEMTATRLIKQVAQVYQTTTFKKLLDLTAFMTPFHLEKILVDLVRHNDLQIRIDHRGSCVHFGVDLSESQREDLSEGPTLQTLPSETIRCQLVHMSSALQKCLAFIVPEGKKKEMEPIRRQTIQLYHQTKEFDHQRLLQRQHIIEERKEMLENQNLEREELLKRAQEEQLKRQKEEEKERLEREAIKRERERQEEQLKQIHTKQIKDKLMQISKTSYGQKMIEKIDKEELLNLGAEEILQRQVEELEKERKEMNKKLKSQEKSVDYFERARRLIEIPRLKKTLDIQKEKDKEFWHTQEEERVRKLVEEHAMALEHSIRLQRMLPDKEAFIDKLKSSRRSDIERKLNDFNARLEVARKARMAERKEQRHKDRREAFLRQKAEEEQMLHDEELKKQREDEARMETERMQRDEDERAARHKEEIEKREKIVENGEDAVNKPWRPRNSPASEWRKKEQDRMDVWRPDDREKEKDSFLEKRISQEPKRDDLDRRREDREPPTQERWRVPEERESHFASRDIRRDEWRKKDQDKENAWRGSEDREKDKESPFPDKRGTQEPRGEDVDHRRDEREPQRWRSSEDREPSFASRDIRRDDLPKKEEEKISAWRSPEDREEKKVSPTLDKIEVQDSQSEEREAPSQEKWRAPGDRDRESHFASRDIREMKDDRDHSPPQRGMTRDSNRGPARYSPTREQRGSSFRRGSPPRDFERGQTRNMDRGGPRDFERYPPSRDFRGGQRDRDREFGRDRDMGRDRDRGFERDRGFKDSRFGGYREREFDRDDRRGEGGGGGGGGGGSSRADEGGSWRRGPPEIQPDRKEDRSFRREEPREPRDDWRGNEGGSSWRGATRREEPPRQEEEKTEPPRKEPRVARVKEESNEDGWKTVGKKE